MVWADIAELPYLNVRLQMSRHDIVLIGYDDETKTAFVVDNDRADVQEVPYDALARARASQSFPVPTRHTTYFVKWPQALPDLRSAAASALAASAASVGLMGCGKKDKQSKNPDDASESDFEFHRRSWHNVHAALDNQQRALHGLHR